MRCVVDVLHYDSTVKPKGTCAMHCIQVPFGHALVLTGAGAALTTMLAQVLTVVVAVM